MLSGDDARVLRRFAETPLEEVMPLTMLAKVVVDRELERLRRGIADTAP